MTLIMWRCSSHETRLSKWRDGCLTRAQRAPSSSRLQLRHLFADLRVMRWRRTLRFRAQALLARLHHLTCEVDQSFGLGMQRWAHGGVFTLRLLLLQPQLLTPLRLQPATRLRRSLAVRR